MNWRERRAIKMRKYNFEWRIRTRLGLLRSTNEISRNKNRFLEEKTPHSEGK